VNRHGAEALRHWRAYLPASYGRLEDLEEFFAELGEQADAEIEDRYLEYAGPDVPGESAEDKQARLIQAMNLAAEEVFAELVTPSPASQGERDPEDEVPRRSSPHEFVSPARIRDDLRFTRGTPQTLRRYQGLGHGEAGPAARCQHELVVTWVPAVRSVGRVLAAYLSAHRTMINGSALCAALAVTDRD
jgi:hypothetical protein